MSLNAFFMTMLRSAAVVLPPSGPARSAFFGLADGTNRSALLLPAIPGAVAISFLIKPYVEFSSSVGFLFDGRDLNAGDPYIYGSGSSVVHYYNQLRNTTSLTSGLIPAGQWTRVYLEATASGGTSHLLSRYTNNEFFVACHLADVRVYSRQWTSAEIQTATPLVMPTDSVLARYDFQAMNGAQVPDTTGNNRTASVYGPLPQLQIN